jgi:putative transcriptional regulator
MQIHNKIRECREAKKITQEDLATATGVSRQTIIAIEKGNYEPSLGLALKLAKFFKVRVEELFMVK